MGEMIYRRIGKERFLVSKESPTTPIEEPLRTHKYPISAPLSKTKPKEMPNNPPEQRGRRDNTQIRDELQRALQLRPMTAHELAIKISARHQTVMNHLKWLERLRIVEGFMLDNKRIWRLSK